MIEVTEEMRNQAADEIAAKPVAGIMPEASQLVRDGSCPICREKVMSFRDELSVQEFRISGMCQACQDAVFGG